MSTDARIATTANTVDSVVEKLPLISVHYFIIIAAALGFMFDSFDTYIASYAMPAIIKEWKLDAIAIWHADIGWNLGYVPGRDHMGPGNR